MPWVAGGDLSASKNGFGGFTYSDPVIQRVAIQVLNAPDINPRRYGFFTVWMARAVLTGTIACVEHNIPIWHPAHAFSIPSEQQAALRHLRFKHTGNVDVALSIRFWYFTP